MASVAKWGLFRGKVGDIVELLYSMAWPLSFSFWYGFAYADGLGFVISPFIALAYGLGFAISTFRRSPSTAIRMAATVSLAMNLCFRLVPVMIELITRYF